MVWKSLNCHCPLNIDCFRINRKSFYQLYMSKFTIKDSLKTLLKFYEQYLTLYIDLPYNITCRINKITKTKCTKYQLFWYKLFLKSTCLCLLGMQGPQMQYNKRERWIVRTVKLNQETYWSLHNKTRWRLACVLEIKALKFLTPHF